MPIAQHLAKKPAPLTDEEIARAKAVFVGQILDQLDIDGARNDYAEAILCEARSSITVTPRRSGPEVAIWVGGLHLKRPRDIAAVIGGAAAARAESHAESRIASAA